ncbi:MAG: PAS domain S-box protein [Alphaproteobacteria bacterium]
MDTLNSDPQSAHSPVNDWGTIRALINGISHPAIAMDAKGVIRLFNPAACDLFGYQRDDVVGRGIEILMDEPHASAHQGYVDSYLETGEAKIVGIGREVTARHSSGDSLPVDLSVSKLELAEGEIVFIGFLNDLSGKKAAETVAAEEHERFARLVDTTPDGVISIDIKGRIRVYNSACEQIFRHKRADVIGRNISMLMPAHYADHHDSYLSGYAKTGERKIIGIGREVEGLRADGSTFPLDLSVGEVMLASGEKQYIGILRDISQRRETDRRIRDLQGDLAHLSRVAAMNEMGTALAHELNQPLTAMMLYLTACGRQLENAGQDRPELFDKAIGEAERAGEIIRRMRRFVEKGDMSRQPTDLRGLIEEAAGLVNAAEQKGLPPVTLANLPDAPLMAEVDSVQLTQVLVNLMRNAQEAASSGQQARVEVQAGREGGHVHICIHDTGPGVSPDLLQSVFRPFKSSKHDGLGLGLSISKSILTAHSASLEAHNDSPLGGARFCVRLVAEGATE